MGVSRFVAQAGLELLDSSDSPASASQSAEIIGVSHYARPGLQFFKENIPRRRTAGIVIYLLVRMNSPALSGRAFSKAAKLEAEKSLKE